MVANDGADVASARSPRSTALYRRKIRTFRLVIICQQEMKPPTTQRATGTSGPAPHLSVGCQPSNSAISPDSFAGLTLPPRAKVKVGRPTPNNRSLPTGQATSKFIIALEEVFSPLDLPRATRHDLNRVHVCGHRYRDEPGWDQRHKCESTLCPDCVCKSKSIPWKEALIQEWCSTAQIIAVRLSMSRVKAKFIKATISGLRARLKNLFRAKAWCVRKFSGVIHVDLPNARTKDWAVHLHALIEPDVGFSKPAVKRAWSTVARESWFKPADTLAAYAHYMTSVQALIPGYKISKSTRRYEAFSVRADELLLCVQALKGQRRLVQWVSFQPEM